MPDDNHYVITVHMEPAAAAGPGAGLDYYYSFCTATSEESREGHRE